MGKGVLILALAILLSGCAVNGGGLISREAIKGPICASNPYPNVTVYRSC